MSTTYHLLSCLFVNSRSGQQKLIIMRLSSAVLGALSVVVVVAAPQPNSDQQQQWLHDVASNTNSPQGHLQKRQTPTPDPARESPVDVTYCAIDYKANCDHCWVRYPDTTPDEQRKLYKCLRSSPCSMTRGQCLRVCIGWDERLQCNKVMYWGKNIHWPW